MKDQREEMKTFVQQQMREKKLRKQQEQLEDLYENIDFPLFEFELF
jgi:hypothetical protein